MSTGLVAGAYSVGKILALQSQRFNPVDMGNGNGAEAIGDHGVSVNVSSFVVDFQHFRGIGIVVNGHSGITNNGDAANFTRMQPAYMDMR